MFVRKDGNNLGLSVPPPHAVAPAVKARHDNGFPEDALFQVWRKPIGGGQFPISMGAIRPADALKHERVLLVCFSQDCPHQWRHMSYALARAEDHDTPTLLVLGGSVSGDTTGALISLGRLTQMHALEDDLRGKQLVFTPNGLLAHHLGIARNGGITNALILIKNGNVAEKWIAQHDGQQHVWGNISSATQNRPR
jgi:hypothetical protein